MSLPESDYYLYSSDGLFTQDISPTITVNGKTASSILLKTNYIKGDAIVTAEKLTVSGREVDCNSEKILGLSPNQEYNFIYTITVENSEGMKSNYSSSTKIKTDYLTIKTQQPKVVSVGNVIVSAEMNVDEDEENVGFEWRRTDWSNDFASNTGTGIIYDGMMEGIIHNLNENYLWKYRPYYGSYYGDWVGIDPSNTSYFKPTVHTYETVSVDENTAMLKGYAMQGTDDITEQGFEYWVDATASAKAWGAPADSDVKTVTATGQRMIVTLTDLQPGTTYGFRAYVKTASGTTYGEERTFTTTATTGIINIAEEPQPTVKRTVQGIYTLTGVKVSDDANAMKSLPRGIYIVNGKQVAVK